MISRNCIPGLLLVMLVLTGCTTTGSVSVTRLGATGLGPGDSVAIILAQHQTCTSGEKCSKPESHASAEQSASACLANGIYPAIYGFKLVQAADFRQEAGLDANDSETEASVSRMLALFENPDVGARLAARGLRYVIVLTSSTHISPGQLHLLIDNISLVGREWTRSSSLTAEILDLMSRRHAGSLTVSSTGKSGFTVPFLAFIPLPLLIPYSSPTESEACHSLGRSVAEFILNPKQERGSATDVQ